MREIAQPADVAHRQWLVEAELLGQGLAVLGLSVVGQETR